MLLINMIGLFKMRDRLLYQFFVLRDYRHLFISRIQFHLFSYRVFCPISKGFNLFQMVIKFVIKICRLGSGKQLLFTIS